MKTILKKIRRCAYLDNKDYFDTETVRIKSSEIAAKNIKETRLYKCINQLTDKELRQVVLLCMTGREFSSYYGGANKIIRPIDYLEYFKGTRTKLGATREDDISFLIRYRFEILNYIDRVLKIVGEE